jgi:hypothetical protein
VARSSGEVNRSTESPLRRVDRGLDRQVIIS